MTAAGPALSVQRLCADVTASVAVSTPACYQPWQISGGAQHQHGLLLLLPLLCHHHQQPLQRCACASLPFQGHPSYFALKPAAAAQQKSEHRNSLAGLRQLP